MFLIIPVLLGIMERRDLDRMVVGFITT